MAWTGLQSFTGDYNFQVEFPRDAGAVLARILANGAGGNSLILLIEKEAAKLASLVSMFHERWPIEVFDAKLIAADEGGGDADAGEADRAPPLSAKLIAELTSYRTLDCAIPRAFPGSDESIVIGLGILVRFRL